MQQIRQRAGELSVGIFNGKGDRAMADAAIQELGTARARSVQDHIDELPMWADGTHLPSAAHIWVLSHDQIETIK
jgi:hypothetical protein